MKLDLGKSLVGKYHKQLDRFHDRLENNDDKHLDKIKNKVYECDDWKSVWWWEFYRYFNILN